MESIDGHATEVVRRAASSLRLSVRFCKGAEVRRLRPGVFGTGSDRGSVDQPPAGEVSEREENPWVRDFALPVSNGPSAKHLKAYPCWELAAGRPASRTVRRRVEPSTRAW